MGFSLLLTPCVVNADKQVGEYKIDVESVLDPDDSSEANVMKKPILECWKSLADAVKLSRLHMLVRWLSLNANCC
jgi:hypothetical protein